jgi:hypothetical protein
MVGVVVVPFVTPGAGGGGGATVLLVMANVSRTTPSDRIIQACNLLCDTSKQNDPNSFNEVTIAG